MLNNFDQYDRIKWFRKTPLEFRVRYISAIKSRAGNEPPCMVNRILTPIAANHVYSAFIKLLTVPAITAARFKHQSRAARFDDFAHTRNVRFVVHPP